METSMNQKNEPPPSQPSTSHSEPYLSNSITSLLPAHQISTQNSTIEKQKKPDPLYPFTVYQCYKPTTHEETKEYIDYILGSRTTLANVLEELDSEILYNDPEEQPSKTSLPLANCNNISLSAESRLRTYLFKVQELPAAYLSFDSNFECGNLERAIAKSELEYDLYVNSDTNATSRRQWFYFSVSNTKKGQTVRFNVINLTKFPHFLKEGMKPLVFSEADNDVAWTNKTDRIQIIKNASVPSSSGERTIPIDTIEENECTFPVRTGNGYTLSFAHTFKYDNDKVYFAFWKPYSYTRLQKFFQKCETDLIKEGIHKPFPWKKKHSSCWINAEAEIETRDISYKREQLCLSLGGVPVDLLTITASSQQSEDAPYLSYRNRSYVVITARVHAGETAGSYKAEGIIRFLLGKDPIAVALRQEHIFLIVPMLNPDGVVLGNNRCSLGGCDLNRCWGSPKRDLQPTIFQLKALLGELFASRKQISVYCDLHGHSQMLNSFIFACHTVSSSSVTSWTKVRLLPRIFSRKCHILKYSQCRFKVEPDKLNTARVIIWKEFGVINSFTLESSQYAYNIGEEVVRFTEKDYLKVATGFMEALHEYGRLLDQLQTEMKEYRKTHEPMFETTIERAETKPRRNEKLKIRVQMTRIPAFHKAQTRTFDSAESNNTENESNSSKNAASPSSVEQAAENNEYQCETPFKPSWKDYFTPQELEEITDELNFKEKQFVEDLSEPEEEDELELGPFLGNGKYVEDKKEEVVEKSPVQKKNNRTNFEYKDLIHVGYVKKSREMWDSWSSRIVHISPNKVQKKLPERPALEPKRNFSRDRALPRPGTTSATLGERSRKQRFEVDSRKMIPISHGKGYNEGMLLPCWETMQPYLTACEQPRGLIARFPPQPSPIRVRASKPVRGTSNNNAMRVCLVPAEGEKGMARIFQMQRQQSVRRHRPSIDAIPRKSKPVMKNPFTNSKIREHMGSRREYN